MRRGYVFVLALWTIVILAVLSGAAFTAMSSANATLRAIIDRERSITAFTDAEARLLYLLLTEPIGLSALHVGGQLDPDPTIGGFAFGGELVDTQGAPYRMNTSQGPVIVRLIAANGLINLSGDTVLSARALLTAQGLSEPAARRLAARLADYADGDDLKRLGGAEHPDYPELTPPGNAPLRTASEACAVLGWREEVPLCRDPRLLDLFAFAGNNPAMSARLAPHYLIKALVPGMRNVERAMNMLNDRSQLVRFSDLGIEGLDMLEDNTILPGPSFLIVTHQPSARLIRVTRVDLSLANFHRPYSIVFSHTLGGSEAEGFFHVEDIDTLASLPVLR